MAGFYSARGRTIPPLPWPTFPPPLSSASQRILGGISQLANGRVKPLAKPDIELNRSKSVCVGIHELPPWWSKFSSAPPYAPNRLTSARKPTIRLLGEAGLRGFHAILAKPTWTKESGSGYLLNRLQLRERAALIGVELAIPVVQAMFTGRQGFSPEHTTFSGKGKLKYRPLAANRFRKIGMMSELHGTLAANLARDLPETPCPR